MILQELLSDTLHRRGHRAQVYAAYADRQAALFRRRFGRETFRVLVVTTPDFDADGGGGTSI